MANKRTYQGKVILNSTAVFWTCYLTLMWHYLDRILNLAKALKHSRLVDSGAHRQVVLAHTLTSRVQHGHPKPSSPKISLSIRKHETLKDLKSMGTDYLTACPCFIHYRHMYSRYHMIPHQSGGVA